MKMTKNITLNQKLRDEFAAKVSRYYLDCDDKLPDIKSTENIISAYDLYEILRNEFFDAEKAAKQLLESMKNYCKHNRHLLLKIFECKDELIIPKCTKMKVDTYDDKIELRLFTSERKKYKMQITLNIKTGKITVLYRENENINRSDCIELTNLEELECIEAHLPDIKKIYARQVQFFKTYGKPKDDATKKIKSILEQIDTIGDDEILVNFSYVFGLGCVIKAKELEPFSEEISKKYEFNSITYHMFCYELNEKKNIILKKIPIDIDSLPESIKTIINRQRELTKNLEISYPSAPKIKNPFTRKRTKYPSLP